jgi:hypothetical protein
MGPSPINICLQLLGNDRSTVPLAATMKEQFTRPFALISAVILLAALFTWLFKGHPLGLNLLLFNLAILAVLFIQGRISLRSQPVLLAGTLVSAVMVVVHATEWAIFMNILSLFLLTGSRLLGSPTGINYAALFALVHLPMSHIALFSQVNALGSGRPHVARIINVFRIVLIPLAVIALFVAMYRGANPVFLHLLDGVVERLQMIIDLFTRLFDPSLIFTFLFGVAVCDFLLLHHADSDMINMARQATDRLIRVRRPSKDTSLRLGLRRELRSSLFLLVALNMVLAVVNAIDIYWVWFNFEWDGDYLKQFVHEGTYLLIWSILVSVGVTLFIFRGNLSFMRGNSLLRWSAYVWIGQNLILAISVAIRNIHYIRYYALAHGRIGVFFFLAVIAVGLVTLIIKVHRTRSVHYLLRTNILSAYLIMLCAALVHWDVVIARFNFSHAHRSFVHFNYLITLSDAALPYLDKDLATLQAMEQGNARFPAHGSYMAPVDYLDFLRQRKDDFNTRILHQHWLSWNLADQKAFRQLKGM